jgi:transcriptional regulator of acetoin/glycerol metabolism
VTAARRRYFDHGDVRVEDVPASVLRSWQRCLEAGHRTDYPVSFEMIGRNRVREIDEGNRALVEAAREEVDELGRVVSRAHMVVLLTDAGGIVVETGGDIAAVSPRLRLAARKGVDMSEATIGTNAIGTALLERGPVEIVAREHYFDANTVHTCVGAPLFAPDGRLIGALDVSGDYRPDRANLVELVSASARAIENRLMRRMPGVCLLTFSQRQDLLGTPWEAVAAFDSSGAIVGANTAARSLLGLLATPRPGRFEDLFDARFAEALRTLAHRELPSSLQCASGVQVLARMLGEGAGPRARTTSPARMSDAAGSAAKREATLGFLHTVSRDKPTADAVARARCAYDRDVPALLVGETGTGKELVARALHYLGRRAEGPFVAVNCASLPESLVEAELFGYVEGAFTGARRGGAPGRLELAHGGTLFLDEIGDMPLASQAKLLRVLQERCVTRLGDTRERPIDFCLVCATHQQLPQLITGKAFREDLYYRINGLCVTLPPLRQRSNILDLARHLLRQQGPHELSPGAERLLLNHPWPGNLRQLGHVVSCAVALAGDAPVIEPEHFPEDFLAATGGSAAQAASAYALSTGLVTLDEAESVLIERTLRACHGNVSAAARTLGVSRSTLYNKLKRS